MMAGKLRLLLPVITVLLLFPAHAPAREQGAPAPVPAGAATDAGTARQEPVKFTLPEAIQYALDHSHDMQEAYLTLREMQEEKSKANFFSKKLTKAGDELEQGRSALSSYRQQLDAVTQRISQIESSGLDLSSPENAALKATYDYLVASREQLTAVLEAGQGDLLSGQLALTESIAKIREGLSDAASASALLKAKGQIGLDVAAAGVLIQQQGLALQVQNAYYGVLEKQRLVKVQEDSLALASQLYQFAANSYETGFSAKDEFLLSGLQVKAGEMKLLEARHNLETAENALKILLNFDPQTDIQLEDDFVTGSFAPDLQTGLARGLGQRLEILKADGELALAQLDFSIMAKTYTPNTFYYQEAELRQDKAALNLARQRQAVQVSILDSYDAVLTAQQAVAATRDMQAMAKENLEIATLKYEAGFGENSKLLKQSDLESLSGTIAEVLAAQQKLSEVDAAVVTAIYNYNLALAKYAFDTAASYAVKEVK